MDAHTKKWILTQTDKGLRNLLLKVIQKEVKLHSKNETVQIQPEAELNQNLFSRF